MECENEAMVWWLIEHGANVTGPVYIDGKQTNILSRAAVYCSSALLRRIIEIKRRDLPPDDDTLAKELGAYGLCYAVCAPVYWDRLDSIRLLLDEGADPCASGTGHAADTPAVVIAARKQNLEALELLLDRGADVNAAGSDKTTPLMIAVGIGNEEMVHLCLDRGADPTVWKTNGEMTLSLAGQSRLAWETVQRLFFAFVDAGGDLNSIETEGPLPHDGRAVDPTPYYLPLQSVVAAGKIPAVRLLLRHGADPRAKGLVGATALHVAMEKYETMPLLFRDIVKELVNTVKRVGGSLDDTMEVGWTRFLHPIGSTALHMAARRNAADVIGVLLANGADPTILDSDGRSAVEYATEWRHKKCVDLLSRAIESRRVGAS